MKTTVAYIGVSTAQRGKSVLDCKPGGRRLMVDDLRVGSLHDSDRQFVRTSPMRICF